MLQLKLAEAFTGKSVEIQDIEKLHRGTAGEIASQQFRPVLYLFTG